MKYIKLFEDFEGDNGLDITNLSSLVKSKSFKEAGDLYLSHVESLGYLSSFLQDFAETLTEVSKNLGINQDDIEAEDDYQGSGSGFSVRMDQAKVEIWNNSNEVGTIRGEVKILHAWTNAVLYQGKLELTEEGGVSRNSYGEEEFDGDNKLELSFNFEDFFKNFEEGLRIFNDTDLYNEWSAKNR